VRTGIYLCLILLAPGCADDERNPYGDPRTGDPAPGDTGMGDGMGDTGMGDTGMGDTGMGDPQTGDPQSDSHAGDGDTPMGDAPCAGAGCCTGSSFCPTVDTTLSGAQAFDYVYIPAGVTVTCVGTDPLELAVSGEVLIEGVLTADGVDAPGSSDTDALGACSGFDGGDGFRGCTGAPTTFCETTPTSEAECQAFISPKETVVGAVCEYLSNAPGEPGYGPGGGSGGEMAHPLASAAPGSAAGGGGASYGTSGTAGGDGSTNCPSTPAGGAPGPTVAHSGGVPEGGSGGGGGGLGRAGACDLTCALGCTTWGGDGGAGGGVIVIDAAGEVEVSGLISARGGEGAESGGATCGGGGGGGSGGAIHIATTALVLPGTVGEHLDVTGGAGGASGCPGLGAGGDGGDGLLLMP